jgi:hypothetical protein
MTSSRKLAKQAALESRKRSWSHVVRRGDKRVAVGWWSSPDGTECYGDWWAPTSCAGPANDVPHAIEWEGMAKVSIMQWSNGWWRVCVWGGDDFGLEHDTADEQEARRLFDRINHLVRIDDLRSWGFVPG